MGRGHPGCGTGTGTYVHHRRSRAERDGVHHYGELYGLVKGAFPDGKGDDRSIKEQAGKLYAARERLRVQLGRDATVGELSQETGLEIEVIASIDTATAQVASLQAETAEGLTLESALGDSGMEESLVEQIALRDAIASLPQRERMVIVLRYYRSFTQERTARVIGVSQVQVSRIERKAVQHLREKLL